MISLLIGQPKITRDSLTILVNGVGYAVVVSPSTLAFCQNKESVELSVSTHVSQDAIELFGFSTAGDKYLFQLLLSVSGVGPRTALNITDRGQQPVIAAIQKADVSFFSHIPRVGKKTAQKIIIELKSKLGGAVELDLAPLTSNQQTISDALQTLGFDESDVERVIKTIDTDEKSIEQAVKEAIKLLGQRT